MFTARTVLVLMMLLTLSPRSNADLYAPFECCFDYVKSALRLTNLVGFYSTPRECYLPAIVFQTRRGAKVCANPKERWVNRAIEML